MGIWQTIKNTASGFGRMLINISDDATKVPKDLYEVAYLAPRVGVPDAVKETYDNALKNAGKSLWKNMLKVGASGFGKGIAITAAVLVTGFILTTGYLAAAGVAAAAGSAAAPTLAQGLAAGFEASLYFLTSIPGMLTMALGGMVGAGMDIRKAQNSINVDIAKVQAADYALSRELNQTLALQKELQAERDTLSGDLGKTCGISSPEGSFCAREAAKRRLTEQTVGR